MERMAKPDYKKPDYYAKRAKEKGYAARSVFKLEEVDEKENLLRPGIRVLDLGASPGSWMQYASKKAGKNGLVVGVDLNPLNRELNPNEKFIQGDVYELEPEQIWEQRFNLVLSDMMPNTIGHKASDHYRSVALAERALYIADALLRPGGHFLVKVFQGADFESYRNSLRERFFKVKVKKPKSSRSSSREIYLLGLQRSRDKEDESHGG